MPTGRTTEPSDLTRAVAAVIRAQMGYRDITQADLVRQTGVSQPTVSRIVKGERSIDMEMLHKVCRVLRVSVSAVIDQAEETMNHNVASISQLRPKMSEDTPSLVERSAARRGKGNKKDDGDIPH